MVRSPGFGSNSKYLIALFRLAFTVAPSLDLTLHLKLTRWIVLQKARRHPAKGGAPTPCRHTVSGSISLPSRGSFHLSITVLVHYRSHIMFSLGRWSCRIQTGFLVPRPTRENKYKVNVAFVYAAITLSRGTFQLLLLATSDFLPYPDNDSSRSQITVLETRDLLLGHL